MKHKKFQTQQHHFAKNAQGISKFYHEVLVAMKFLQTKPQVKKMNINYYDLYYTVTKNRDDKGIVDTQYENNDNDYIDYEAFITPNHYIRIKTDNVMLR